MVSVENELLIETGKQLQAKCPAESMGSAVTDVEQRTTGKDSAPGTPSPCLSENKGAVVIPEKPLQTAAFVDATPRNGPLSEDSKRRSEENARKRRELLARLNLIDSQKSELERARQAAADQDRSADGIPTSMAGTNSAALRGDHGAALSNQDSSAHHDENAVVGSSQPMPDKETSEVTKGDGIRRRDTERASSGWGPQPTILIEDQEHSMGPSTGPKGTPASPTSLSSPTGCRSARVRTPSVLLSSQPGEGFNRRVPGSNTRLFQYSVKVVKEFLKMKEAGSFGAPIKELWPGEAIPGYFDIIDKPMDLRTLLRNLESGVYSSIQSAPGKNDRVEEMGFDADSFANDMRLIFRNAMLYNRVGDHFYELARTLLERFERKLEQAPTADLVATVKKSPPLKRKKSGFGSRSNSQKKAHLDGFVELSGAVSTVREVKKSKPKREGKAKSTKKSKTEKKMKEEEQLSIEELVKKLTSLKRDKLIVEAAALSSPGSGPVSPPIKELAEHPMSYDEKKRLGEAINHLPPEKLGKLVQIVAKRSGKAEMNGDEEIELDIDAMDNRTLREMEAYINSANVKRRGRKPTATLPQLISDIDRVEAILEKRKAESPEAAAQTAAELAKQSEAPSSPPAGLSPVDQGSASQDEPRPKKVANVEKDALSDSDSSDESGSDSDSDCSDSSSDED